MRVIVALLIAIAAGFAVYTAGAIIWTIIDPQVAASSLLFTIPRTIVGTIVPALIAFVLMFTRRFAA
jgi:hypothetical protein